MRTVLMLMDSLNRRFVNAYADHQMAITPNLDAFCGECLRYDNHFIGSAPCMPARRDLFTGRLNFLERSWGPIEPFDVTLPGTLRKSGVFTHITTDHTHYFETGGENYVQMFNTWDYHRGQEYDPWVSRMRPFPLPERFGQTMTQYELNRTRFQTDGDYPTPQTFRSACRWAEENRGEDNFFLSVETFDPHEPFDCPQEFHDLYDPQYSGKDYNWSAYAPVTEPENAINRLRDSYRATLSMADKWFGRFIQALKDNDLYENTLIILTSDHGHLLGEHGFTGKNFMPVYNELAHIPLFIRLPDGSQAGTAVDTLTQNIDLMPTILAHHQLSVPPTVKGRSLLPSTENSQPPRKQIIYGWFGRAVNVCDGTYTYFRAPLDSSNTPLYQYCAIPSTIGRYYGADYAKYMEMGRFLPYTQYPVYRIPMINPWDIGGRLEYVMSNELFNIKNDYEQKYPLQDRHTEDRMLSMLVQGMQDAEAPQEQFIRLGLT